MGRLTFTAIAHAEGFANEFTEGGEVGRIRMPYGEYDYGETKCPDGLVRRIVQVWDEASARAVRDALPAEGYPVYQGHPDVPEVAAKYPNKAAVGWVTAVEVANDAATLSVEWIANPGKGFKWFSPYWCGEAEAAPGDAVARVHVEGLTSVGLVNNPRIKQFTLANEWGAATEQRKPTGEETRMDITKLAALLGLPVEGLTEEQVVQEITNLQKAAVEASETAKVAADDAAAQVAAGQAEVAAAKREADAAKTAFANERAARIELLLDNAIAGGNITPAGKAAWRERLEKDVETGALALCNERAVKVAPAVTPEKAAGRSNSHKLLDLANELMSKDGRLDFTAAFLRAKAEHPELAK